MSHQQATGVSNPSSYYPMPPAYSPALQQVVTAPCQPVVVQPVVVQQRPTFGQHPLVVMCPEGHQVTTQIEYKNGDFTYIAAAILCLFLGPVGIVPFYMDSMKDVEHRCPIDGTVLGLYKRTIN